MNLTPEQKNAVSGWLAGGASIAEVQKRLREQFQVSLTYIDTRFLIDDLGLNVKSAPPPKPAAAADLSASAPAPKPPGPPGAKPGQPPPPPAGDTELVDEGDAFDEGVDEFADDAGAEPASGVARVKVDVDRIMRPGSVVSGTVTFSDGQTGKWALDQVGRLIFESGKPGYRPSQGDLQEFQRELSVQLQRQGY